MDQTTKRIGELNTKHKKQSGRLVTDFTQRKKKEDRHQFKRVTACGCKICEDAIQARLNKNAKPAMTCPKAEKGKPWLVSAKKSMMMRKSFIVGSAVGGSTMGVIILAKAIKSCWMRILNIGVRSVNTGRVVRRGGGRRRVVRRMSTRARRVRVMIAREDDRRIEG